jgi:diacylglycerol kinase (ATP)
MDPHKKNIGGLRRIWNAQMYTLRGLAAAYRNEAAFRQELGLAVVLAPLGIWLGTTGVERALLVGSLLLVLMVELLNSGIEAVVDRVGLERHALSGLAKDIGSAAVFISLMNVLVVWGLVLWPHYGPGLLAKFS